LIPLNTDLSSLLLQRTLNKHTIGLNSAIERLTTGYRINRAKDDAAGYYISSGFLAKQSSMVKIMQNVDDGLDLLSTAEGALDNMYGLLQRLRDLAETAANGTYTEDSRRAMQAEADLLVDQIGTVRETTEYNGLNVFSKPKKEPTTGGVAATNTFSLSSPEAAIDISENTSTSTMMRSSAPMIMSAASVAEGDTIQGAEDFTANQTKTITIDGVTYEVTNRQSVASSLAYTKDTTTGQITFLCDNFIIKGQVDVSHNLLINGQYNRVYGGDEADVIEGTEQAKENTVWGQGGDDTILLTGGGIYGGDGDDNLTGTNTSLHGEAGNDVLNCNNATSNLMGGTGNDIFYIKGVYTFTNINGGDGDDTFHVYSAYSTPIINGGSGTNIVATENVADLIKVNVEGANAYLEEFAANETKTININGIDYSITNKRNSLSNFIYQITSDNQIIFSSSQFTIRGDENKAHNVKLTSTYQTFYGGKHNDTIVSTGNSQNVIYSSSGDDIITSSTRYAKIFSGDGDDDVRSTRAQSYLDTGDGNDNIYTSGNDNFVNCGGGDDIVTTTGSRTGIYGGNGTNQITNNSSEVLICGFGDSDNSQAVELSKNETLTVDFVPNASYSIKNNLSYSDTNFLLYSFDNVTGQVSVNAHYCDLTALSNEAQNVDVYGYSGTFRATNQDDTINSKGQGWIIYGGDGNDSFYNSNLDNSLYGESGNDYFEQNSGTSICLGGQGDDTVVINVAQNSATGQNGGVGNDIYYLNAKATIADTSGNDIYHINTDGTSIAAGMDGDTFYVNGNNNTIKGSGGDDYFIITGNNNTVDGGSGTNYYVDKGTGTVYSNSEKDPYVGELTFTTLNEEQIFEVNGKTYTVTNNISNNNILSYSFNPNTGILNIDGSDFEINAKNDESAVIELNGDNNTVNGSNLADKITVKTGTNNTINGNAGNDVLVNESENNSFNGGLDNDTIILTQSTNKAVMGGTGNDTINVSSDNNTNIDSGIGDDKLNITGSNNVVQTNDGNNTISTSGNDNTITSGNGNNKLTITGDNNTITAGSGNNTLGVGGDNNNITIEKIQGSININGNENSITQTNGDNNVVIKGSGNIYTSTNGQKEMNIVGDDNNISTSNSDDEFTVRGNGNILETTGGENKVDIKGNSNEYHGGNEIDSIKVYGDSNILLGGDGDDSFLVNRGSSNVIDGQGSDKNTMIDYGINTNSTNVIDMTPDAFTCDLQVGLTSSQDSVISIEINFNLAGFDVDLSTTESAREALESIDEALARLSEQHLNIGATMNRLESVREAQMVQLDNITSSLSTIRDTDVAKESANLIRQQILQQAAASLLVQSRNLKQQSVLDLINSVKIW